MITFKGIVAADTVGFPHRTDLCSYFDITIFFLAVQNSSIGDLVTHSLTHSVRYFYFLNSMVEKSVRDHSERLGLLETCDLNG